MIRHTLTENVISAILGIGIGLMIIPFMIAEREGRKEVGVEHYVISSEPQIAEVAEEITEEETMEVVEPTEVVETAEFVESEISDPEESYIPYTQKDIYLVGNTVFWEVGTLRYKCTEEEAMKAINMTASCIVNRAKMNYRHFGRTIESQIFADSQYASREKISDTKQDYVDEIFYQVAEEILQNGPVISERLVFQSEGEQGEEVDHINNQHFGLLPESEYEGYISS